MANIERWKPNRAVIPWQPFRELEEMERRFNDAFGRTFAPTWWPTLHTEEWVPVIDVFEKEDKYVVKAEVPGMKKEDIDISLLGDTLTIRGEKTAESESKKENYYHRERSYGSFFRAVALPSNVDADKIEANYADGVLEVVLPKTAEVKPKKIAVTCKEKGGEVVK